MGNKELAPILETYNEDEEFLYSKPYLFIKGYATARDYVNTLRALPLARQGHNGQYRKGTVMVGDQKMRLPYVLHCLKVCSTLINLNFPLSDDELDILFASALCHDLVEDAETLFPKGGHELVDIYHFPERVYSIVSMLSKKTGADEYALNEYFNSIKLDPLALLIKLSDRSHNVEDLYNMKLEKIHKYVTETRRWIYPLCKYAKAHYPELSNGVTLLKSKIVSLTEATEALIEMYEEKLTEKDAELEQLRNDMYDLNVGVPIDEDDAQNP